MFTAAALLTGARALQTSRAARRPGSPAELARRLDPKFRVTPTIRLLSDLAVRSVGEPDRRDIVTCPPRTGKSQSLAIWTPVWALMENPDLKVVLVSYSDELAQSHSREARKIITEHAEFLGYRLAADKTAVGRWRVDGHDGGLLATGINSGVTGFGADCVSGDTSIVTEYGTVSAKRAYGEGHAWIWAFDHATGVAGWHRVEARRRIDGRELVTVRTHGGRVLRCTSDHRVYTRRGYVAAGDLQGTDEILSVGRAGGVPSVRSGVPGVGVGDPQGDSARCERDVLLGVVPVGSVRGRQAVGALRGLSGAGAEGAEGDVLGRVPGRAAQREASDAGLPAVRRPVPADQVAEGLLRPGVRECCSFGASDRPGQLEVQDGDELRELVPVDASDGPGARRAGVRGVWSMPAAVGLPEPREAGHEVAAGDSSHQRAAGGQPAREPDHDVLVVPRDASQVGFDAVSSVGRDRGGAHSVYDFQVAGASNFFAEGLLVHNCMIIDDPIKDAAEADSTAHRRRVVNEYRSTLATRVHPGGSVMLVQTRWHEADLAGHLLETEPDVWTHTNVPAVSEAGVPDALGRPAGVAMTSALGFTAAHYAAARRTSGERVWYALYMGTPSSPQGGLVKREWLDAWRLPVAPSAPVLTVVGVDPSDSGSGDSCGLVAASVTGEGVVAMIADVSAPMTSDAWASAAVQLAVDVGASEIAIEGFSARETYTRVAKEAIKRAQKLGTLKRPIRVTSWPPKGSGRGGGDAVARSSALLQALETGMCRLAGFFPEFEDRAVLWQLGQHQPDNLAALVVAHDVLVHAAGLEWDMADPGAGLLGGGGGSPFGQAGGSVTPIDWMRQSVG